MPNKAFALLLLSVLALGLWGCQTIKSGDTTPPVFGGAKGLIYITPTTPNIGASDYYLTWEAATDNVTPQDSIVYIIYSSAASSEVFNLNNILAVTAAGLTSYEVTAPVNPTSPTYFGVRASDEAGNIDSNTVITHP